MDRFVNLHKPGFIGRKAAAREKSEGPKLARVSLVIEADTADVMGDEPIWARVGDTDFGTVEVPHGYGGVRFGASGKALAKPVVFRDGDWRVVGWVTSGGYAHHVQASMAQGYVPASLAEQTGPGIFEVEILGVRRAARVAAEPLFDPQGARMRM